MRHSKKVAQAEKICQDKFRHYFKHRYDKLLVPKSQTFPIDLIGIPKQKDTDNEQHIFELKNSNTYYIDDFTDGAMIDVSKWNKLVTISETEPYVFYLRFYKDGYILFHINSLQKGDYKEGYYERKKVTVGNGKATKGKCVLINYDAAVIIHREKKFTTNGNEITRLNINDFK
jgi:hypothetical protein